MKYLIFTEKPEGNPLISKGNYVSPTKCEEGWFVSIEFKDIIDTFGWKGYTEVNEITPIKNEEG